MWRRCGRPQKFCLAFFDELDKQLFIKKLLKWANEKCKCFNINKNNKKIEKNTRRYHYFISVYQQTLWYDLQFLRYRVWQTEIGKCGSFFPFPPKSQKNQNFEKMKNIAGDIIILYKCTKNHNHMRYSSWDIEYNRHNFLSFWAIFCPFTPLLTPKIKIWNRCKKTWRYYPITHVYH